MSSSMFTVTAPPSTDIWRKPPNTNSFSAPTHALLPQGPVALASFHRARYSVSDWSTTPPTVARGTANLNADSTKTTIEETQATSWRGIR
ncbi:hypothetical protein FB446DRAFT_761136 [Lentinula raphanica]|nr:hypothetical protein FB446DRAFT_761136 [Lentinula raphanica]